MSKISFLETLCLQGGVIQHLPYHQLRVASVFDSFGVACRVDLASTLKELPPSGFYRVRCVYQLDGTIHYTLHPYTKRTIKHLRVVEDDTIVYDKKYLNRNRLNELYEQRGVCDDVLIVKNGYLSDTTIANIALYDGKRWVTPTTPLLEGTTRKRLLENGTIIAREIHKEDIKSFQKIALMNAMIGFDVVEEKLEDCIC